MEFFAVAISGTEKVLRDELSELGFKSTRLNRGGIPFRGEWQDGWRACLESRIAQRIQLVLRRFKVENESDLYDGVRSIDWLPFITPEQTLSISSFINNSNLNHSGFVALKAKDAIVDQIRDTYGDRPSVDRDDADVRIFIYLSNNKATIYLDLSGESLFKRGYRTATGEAPLKPNLAAALLRMTNWDKTTPLLDPMCGSGTILTEAALWATNSAPGLLRKTFGFERWANFDAESAAQMKEIRGLTRRKHSKKCPKIVGYDINQDVIDMANQAAKNAQIKNYLKCCDALKSGWDGCQRTIITNPPYGVRLGIAKQFNQQLAGYYSKMHGCRVGILSGDSTLEQCFSFRPKEVFEVKNGSLPCRFLVYDIP